jgi:dTDP-4-dehydrorhamnose reductase
LGLPLAPMPTRVLITGAGGMLGQDVEAAAIAAGLQPVALARAELDITDSAAVDAAVSSTRSDVVVNCAGWTDVDRAEAEPDAALAVNGAGAGNVARAAARAEAWTIHVSTDYVFDGTKADPYVESDPTGPVSVYGRTKLAGEGAVAREAPGRHTIVRSSWLFGAGGPCFPATILRRCADLEHLSVVDDQIGCPTFTMHLAQALVALASGVPPLGIVHLAGRGSCSWYDLAVEVVEQADLGCEVRRCSTAEMPRPAQRPVNSVLVSERDLGGVTLPDWRLGVREYMALKVAAR